MPFQIQPGVAPVLCSIIFLTGVEAVGEGYIHWLLVFTGGELLSQRLLTSVEGHLQELSRSNIPGRTLDSVNLTRQQRPITMGKLNRHVVRRLCRNKITTDEEKWNMCEWGDCSKATYGRE